MTLIDDLITAAQAEPRKFVNLIRVTTELIDTQERQQAETERQNNINLALQWWDRVKPPTPTTRAEALGFYRNIEDRIKTETDQYKLIILKDRLKAANEKYKELKALGP